jgi:hypothetical protein
VTEQDVSNEEMYEEEDEDMGVQYQRLSAHLRTNSARFNLKLDHYLNHQIAIHSSMMNANGNMYPQQHYPNAFHAQINNSPMMQPSMGVNHTQMLQMQQPNGQSMYSQGPYHQQFQQQNMPYRPTSASQLESSAPYGNNIRSESTAPSAEQDAQNITPFVRQTPFSPMDQSLCHLFPSDSQPVLPSIWRRCRWAARWK